MKCYLVLLAAAAAMAGLQAQAASFDCAKASSQTEKSICASDQVSMLDEELSKVYTDAARTHTNSNALRASQREWLRNTRDKCQDEACLVNVYQRRIASLRPNTAPSGSEVKPAAVQTPPVTRQATPTASTEAVAEREEASQARLAAARRALAEQSDRRNAEFNMVQAQRLGTAIVVARAQNQSCAVEADMYATELKTVQQYEKMNLKGHAVSLVDSFIASLIRSRCLASDHCSRCQR
jgi:uncharacterized protein